MSFIGFKYINVLKENLMYIYMVHKIANMKLWGMPVSEVEAISLDFVVVSNAFNALSFLPKGTGTARENNIGNVACLICLGML